MLGLKRILVLFDYSIVLTVFECYCSYSNIRLKSAKQLSYDKLSVNRLSL